jgi:isopenicillin N synthase-like dioxygenase
MTTYQTYTYAFCPLTRLLSHRRLRVPPQTTLNPTPHNMQPTTQKTNKQTNTHTHTHTHIHTTYHSQFHHGEEAVATHRAYLPNVREMQQGRMELANQTVVQLQTHCRAAALQVLRAIGLSLGLSQDYFASSHSQYQNTGSTLRFLHYPAGGGRTGKHAEEELSQHYPGAGEHTDYGSITLLLLEARDEGSLEVRTRDTHRWQAVPYQHDTLLVNVGDLLQRWTNDTAVSTPHRVRRVRGERDRFSIAYFFHPNDLTTIAPIPRFVSPTRPARHSPISAIEYLRSRLSATY